jgi:cytochrome c oxidase assembly factor CtaG
MDPMSDAFLGSWPSAPWLVGGLTLTGVVYLRGWLYLHRVDPRRWRGGQPAAFLGGLATLFLALASPIEPFAALFLMAHMVQHLLLMMVVPPLLWLGAPLFPLLRGLPEPVRTYWIAPLFRCRSLRRLLERLTHPVTALVLFSIATWLWHVPAIYELALRSIWWHFAEHACFLGTALLFWYPVLRPYPSRPRWSLWLLLPCLLLADVQNTVLSALFTFSDRPLYAYYAEVPKPGSSVLDDQAAAGVVMWVPGTLAFLVPVFGIGVGLLFGKDTPHTARPVVAQAGSLCGGAEQAASLLYGGEVVGGRIPLPLVSSPPPTRAPAFDLLRIPLLGRFLRWRHARTALQLPLALLAAVLIYDGLSGTQVAPLNLAGVLPWIHWRGLLILALLAAGNVFCLACPFLLPRTLARRFLPGGRAWPRPLRNKWLAVLLLGLFLWAYEAFSLWDSPYWTTWLVLSYFAAAFVIDGFFRGAAFCKYLCPIGQFNFVQSLVSPLEVKVRDPEVCAGCRTRDCIRGRDGIPGCELNLYLPRKAGNMDCTFCLDCVHACPHDNIGVSAEPPGRDLWTDSVRSGVGPLERRPDLAVLILVLVFGAFANAAGMVGPVQEWRDGIEGFLGPWARLLVTTAFYLLTLVVLPLLSAGTAAVLSRRWGRLSGSLLSIATRYAFALVPLGFSMWLAHYSFHFLTSYDAVLPATQRFAVEHGWAFLGVPDRSGSCCRPVAEWLPRLEILCLEVGMLLSLYAGWRISLARCSGLRQALKALLPWAVLIVLLFAAGVWIVLQPMQMRGTLGMLEGGCILSVV